MVYKCLPSACKLIDLWFDSTYLYVSIACNNCAGILRMALRCAPFKQKASRAVFIAIPVTHRPYIRHLFTLVGQTRYSCDLYYPIVFHFLLHRRMLLSVLDMERAKRAIMLLNYNNTSYSLVCRHTSLERTCRRYRRLCIKV